MIQKEDLNEYKLHIQKNNRYIEVPYKIIENNLIKEYTDIYLDIDDIKESITKYLFNKKSQYSIDEILKMILDLKSDENYKSVSKYANLSINNIEEKLIDICSILHISLDDINKKKEELIANQVQNNNEVSGIIDNNYVKSILNSLRNEAMYTLNKKSRYGQMASEYNLRELNEINDMNEEFTDGQYSPILVIYKPAKYNRGEYILDDKTYVYIKRQPLKALIKQERLEERGIDAMGAISYIKLDTNLTNENLQELLAEIYVYGQNNSVVYENIKLADIGQNKVWMTADKLKKEFKELRYYHKNLTQKVKEIYESNGEDYSQISGKYIFNSRSLVKCFNVFKNRDIN